MIELLVVIAIISILMAILLPALKAAKEQVKTSVCIGKLRQAGLAFINYSGDYNGLLPRVANTDPHGDDYFSGWDFALTDYMQGAVFSENGNSRPTFKPYPGDRDSAGRVAGANMDLLKFYCPGYTRRPDSLAHTPGSPSGYPEIATWTGANGIASYQMNNWLGLYGLTQSDRRYQLGRSRADMWKIKGDTMLMYEPWFYDYPDQTKLYYNPTHGYRCPLLYADGHATPIRVREVPLGVSNEYSTSGILTLSESKRTFWGFYMLVDYGGTGTYTFPPVSEW